MSHPSFDASAIAEAATETQPALSPTPPPSAPSPSSFESPADKAERNQLGWLLMVALILALSVAVGLAMQQTSDATPRCGGLYSDCCDNWDDNWGSCPEPRDPDRCGGLYSDCCDNWQDDWGTCPEPRDPDRCRDRTFTNWGPCDRDRDDQDRDDRDRDDRDRDDQEGGLFD